MIERAELSALAKSVKAVIRESLVAIGERIDALEKRFSEIPAGPRGEKGEIGLTGDPGERGERGERGEKGDSGERGLPGLAGESGARGDKGDKGEAGAAVTGEKGVDGKDGRDGRDGISGKDGRDGIDGRDALQLDILPSIDPAKSYPRGTWAKHFGGLARSTGSGWETVIAGLAAVDVIQGDDFRTFTIKTQLTGADQVVATFSMPVLIYREIFKDGTEYARGDVVTWAGAAWHCQADSTRAKPSDGPEWRLMVKRGDHGKDGTDGKPGARGPEGPKGRDGR